MACRIGMTTDLIERRKFWESQYPLSFQNWHVLHTCYSKSEAQHMEKVLAGRYGCGQKQGGQGPENATWYVYYFEHDSN